ncbi:MAG: RNA 3'-terminal phosphate cyclase [Candidatus Micrarchaeota archaeon]|nr:RNA 3'-terminal phosphate cyclase [Candidatus Micrarchaeota archaeon]
MSMIKIDGAMGEGGGQVLRTALSLSCILQRPVQICNIRAGREGGGLKAQHLSVCSLLARITRAKVSGASLGSKEITFEPQGIHGGEYFLDIGTAGSVTLLMQAALPVLLFSGEESLIRLRGGTHVKASPNFGYFCNVFLPAIKKFGAQAEARMLRAGFYPKGGGEAELKVRPSKLAGAEFRWQETKKAEYEIISAMLPKHVAEREEKVVRHSLAAFSPAGERKEVEAACPGNSITIWSGFIGASALGEQGKKAEEVAAEACGAFLQEASSKTACVDSHLADQLLLYAALAEGKSSFSTSKFTSHLKTNAELIRLITERNIILSGEFRVEVV